MAQPHNLIPTHPQVYPWKGIEAVHVVTASGIPQRRGNRIDNTAEEAEPNHFGKARFNILDMFHSGNEVSIKIGLEVKGAVSPDEKGLFLGERSGGPRYRLGRSSWLDDPISFRSAIS
jgi:hypothetical protein